MLVVNALLLTYLSAAVRGELENFEKVEVTDPCNKKIDLFRMFGTSVHAGEIHMSWYHEHWRPEDREECLMRFRGYYLYAQLAFHFKTISLGHADCIYVKQRERFRDRNYYPISGIYGPDLKFCDGDLFRDLNRIYATDDEKDLVLDFRLDSSGYKNVVLAFNVFHTEEECDDYLCHNGRCIPDDIQCNPNNPCGDDSSCKRLTGWEIFGIVAGCIAGLILACCCCCGCRKSKKSSSELTNIPVATTVGQENYPLNDAHPVAEAEGVNTTPVFVYATVSNQSNSDGPPTYTTLTNHRTDTTPSYGYNLPASGITTPYSYTSGQSSEQLSNVAPSAPFLNDSAAISPPPPSYDEVIAQEEKYKVT